MRYYDVSAMLASGEVEKIQKQVLGGKKEQNVLMLRDYYNGVQWFSNGVFTDTTRSGRKVWKINSPDPRDLGVSDGDLSVFNVCSSTVDIYSSYGRGTVDENNSIAIEGQEELASDLNELVNIDILVQRSLTRMSVDSAACWKFTPNKSLEFVDIIEVTPIYLEDKIVGTIRIYEISPLDPIVEKSNIEIKKNQKPKYMEIWMPEDGKMWLYKYINEKEIFNGKAPYEFNPFIFVANKNSEFVKLDEDNLEISDVAKIVPIQDAINKTMTESGIIVSKVAFPIIKVIKEVYEKILAGELDGEKLKKDLSQLSLVAGKIIAAPIEINQGVGLPAGIDTYINSLFDQLYRLTGIPKNVYVTEGLGNISSETLSGLMESLKRKVDEKRTYIEQGIKQYVAMYTGDPKIKDSVSIQWAEMIAMPKTERADMLVKQKDAGFPISYVVEKFMDLTGDVDRLDEVLQLMGESDPNIRVEVERQKITNQMKAESDKQLEAERKARKQTEDKLREAEIEKALAVSGLEMLNSQL